MEQGRVGQAGVAQSQILPHFGLQCPCPGRAQVVCCGGTSRDNAGRAALMPGPSLGFTGGRSLGNITPQVMVWGADCSQHPAQPKSLARSSGSSCASSTGDISCHSWSVGSTMSALPCWGSAPLVPSLQVLEELARLSVSSLSPARRGTGVITQGVGDPPGEMPQQFGANRQDHRG